MDEDEYLVLSDIHNYAVCPRRFALRALEEIYGEIWRTVDGTIMHQRAHDGKQVEKRGNTIIMRALKVCSHKLKVCGECDVVEFRASDNGVEINGYEGKYIPFPIEYKRGVAPETSDCDRLQLCAQAMSLEEMLLCDVPYGALFYGETHRRVDVQFTKELRDKVVETSKEMYRIFERGHTPKPKRNEFCNQCSHKDDCLTSGKKSVKEYINKYLQEEG